MTPLRVAFFLPAALAAAALCSCASPKKRSQAENGAPLLRAISIDGDVDEETVERLKEIADDPNSQLAVADEEGFDDSATMPLAVENGGETFADPAVAWKRPGLNPRSITPGDIFTDNAGPILNKTLSLADEFDDATRRKLMSLYTSAGNMRVPMTISAKELAEIKARSAAVGVAPELPSRSVALDFRAQSYSADSAKLETLYADLSAGNSDAADEFRFPESTQKKLAEIKNRLAKGEKLYVITGVTESDTLSATYPGAPIGKRDAEPIRNAIQGLYPHLDSLSAVKQDKSVVLSGEPRVLWEFEARELKLDNGRISIDSTSLVQL